MTAEDTVRMAISATAPGPDWPLRVRDNIRNIAAMLHDHSSEMELARQLDPGTEGTKSFINTVMSMGQYEPKSKRWVVELEIAKSGKGAGKVETIRSGRDDTAEGRNQIAALKAAVGQKCVFFVYLKTMGNNDKVRELVHFVPLGDQSVPAASHTSAPPPADAEPASERAPTGRQDSAPAAPSGADPKARAKELLASLSGSQKAKLSQAAKDNGIPNIMNPGDRIEDLESLARMIKAGHEDVANAAVDAALAKLDPNADPYPDDAAAIEGFKEEFGSSLEGYEPIGTDDNGEPIYAAGEEPFT